ncbi:uncharacterized protein N7487_011772 [Penicillium crustosum]|uniref:uncharacterized protein n=1 Tax=Penicillium crustosum TaxID=36656 RepID=UPI002389B597|nr:uncharacterized protein N7487_011772 [Penicillium crustosum]KAJ5394131.1 hypothetical protein N7487_011772 [Penicillium crustosum]
MANNAAMMAAYKRPDASSSPRPPLPPTTSVEATAPPPLSNSIAAPRDNPGVDSELLSRFGNENNAYEDLAEKLASEDEPDQSETTQGPHKERGNSRS